jgi:alpha-glucosidase
MNYYFIYHARLADIITDYTALTGRMPLPPLWSLGYQQNRYSYFPDTEVVRIASTLREKHIPADGITLDIHYMDAYKLFTWNKDRFPDPQALTSKLKSMGLRLTVIVDPGIKVEKGYPAFESGMQNDIFLKYPDGTNYTAKVWPGWCHFPDFTSPKGRNWWSGQIQAYMNQGVSGIWNDMNEISTWGQQVPENVLYNYDGLGATNLQGHNVYALEMVRASYEGAKTTGQRPFILTRSGFAGLQRYSAIWTGDNRAEENHYFTGIRMLESLGLSGVAFTGMDVGGFTGNPPANLFARWIELGAFIPYYRNHTQINSRSSEPWTYGEDIEEISRDYVSLRYRLLPYLYSIFYEATQDGLPVLRSLAIPYTQDSLVYALDFQNQFLFGPSLLVAPVGADQGFAKVYLPAGNWYNLYTGQSDTGGQQKIIPLSLDKLPVYVKGGSIIPEQSLVQTTAQMPADTLWLHVYKGSQDGDFSYYEDDGNTFAYVKGDFYLRKMHYDAVAGTLQLEAPQGSRGSRFHHLQLVLHGFDGLSQVNVNGASIQVKTSTWDFLLPPTFQDPTLLSVAQAQAGCPVKTVDIDNTNTTIKVKF